MPLTIESIITGHPTPAIQWYKNDFKIFSNLNNQKLCYDGNTVTLQLTNASLNDSGIYICYAKNEHGETFIKVELILKIIILF